MKDGYDGHGEEPKDVKTRLAQVAERLQALTQQAQQAINSYAQSAELFSQAINVLGNVHEYKKFADATIRAKDETIRSNAERIQQEEVFIKEIAERNTALANTLIVIKEQLSASEQNTTAVATRYNELSATNKKGLEELLGQIKTEAAKFQELGECARTDNERAISRISTIVQSVTTVVEPLRSIVEEKLKYQTDALEKLCSELGTITRGIEQRSSDLDVKFTELAETQKNTLSDISSEIHAISTHIDETKESDRGLFEAYDAYLRQCTTAFGNLANKLDEGKTTTDSLSTAIINLKNNLEITVSDIARSNENVIAEVKESRIKEFKARKRFYNAMTFIGLPIAIIAAAASFYLISSKQKDDFTYSNVSVEDVCKKKAYSATALGKEYCDPDASRLGLRYIHADKDGNVDYIIVQKKTGNGTLIIGTKDNNGKNKRFFDKAGSVIKEQDSKLRGIR